MNEKPIFIQLKEMLEDNIISGGYSAGELIISSTQICKLYNVNPATAMRALSELANDEVLLKDRGIGMRVTLNAKANILKKRKEAFLDSTLESLTAEAKKLGITKDELCKLIEQKYNK